MLVMQFIDLPDLVILDILSYLSPFDAIQAFYNIANKNVDERILNLLIEKRCFSVVHRFRLSIFNFICDNVLPLMGNKLSHLTLYDHQLGLAHRKQILQYMSNMSSLHLINVIEVVENNNHFAYFLHQQLKRLTVEFLSEDHIEAQAYICEQFVFHKRSENLKYCHLLNKHGVQLQHLNLSPNYIIEKMTIDLKQLSDLHILFDYLLNIRILNVTLCRWTVEDIKYDYAKLPKKLSRLNEFSIHSQHALSFNQMTTIIRYLIHLRKLVFTYRNYDEHGIDISQLDSSLKCLNHLTELHFIIKFIYFSLNSKQTFENHIQLKQRWNIQTYQNSKHKNYLAYTQQWIDDGYSISTDVLLEDKLMDFPSILYLNLTTHTKQLTLSSMIHLLNQHFPSITHLRFIDSFGIEDTTNDNYDSKLLKIHSFDASEIRISNVFEILLQSMPNLIHLHVNSDVLLACDLRFLLAKNKIKRLELTTNNLDHTNSILHYFTLLEHLVVTSRKQSSQYKRKTPYVVFDWFYLCPHLYTIHIHAYKLSDLFHLVPMRSEGNVLIQCSNEMLTIWK